ncbi:MAG: UDP-N-acetylglucosamine 1-carboxyvinyltransferase [Clostridia bacterium]|nr:UDP-N-acetylglucosamine 1-carboxyvinyltransferase [Clostridia bacterium]
MEKIEITGGNRLYGTVDISGMKNAALPIIFSCILIKGKCIIENLPTVKDITNSLEILSKMGASVKMINRNTVEIDCTNIKGGSSPYELVRKIRASSYLYGAELGRFGRAYAGLPGGCDFGGVRPIDQHIKGFEALGAKVTTEGGYLEAVAENGLRGAQVFFDVITVGATINVMLASVCAKGTTIIDNAAREPHIVDLANFLNTCGAHISGAGTDTIKIKGVSGLHGCNYAIIPDMIEAGTYMTAVAATGGKLKLTNVIPKHLESISAKLEEMGCIIEEFDDNIIISRDAPLKKANIKTMPYPGFPTDMHPQIAIVLCMANGVSYITEGVFETRFRYVDELRRMGANIKVDGKTAIIEGGSPLSAAPVKAVDLRAGAAMIVAGLAIEGKTEITDVHLIERGFDDIVGKLTGIGANIKKVICPDEDSELARAN